MRLVAVVAFYLLLTSLDGMGQTFEWGKAFPSANQFTLVGTVASPLGGFFSYGYFTSTLTIGSEAFDAEASFHGIVIRHDNEGNVVWARELDFEGYGNVRNATVDNAGDIYFTGTVNGPFTFGTETIAASTEGNDYYFAKYDNAGNPQWIKKLSNSHLPNTQVDHEGNVLLLTSDYPWVTGSISSYLYKYSSSGTLIYKKVIGTSIAPSYGIPAYVAVNENGQIFISGYFTGLVSFGTTTLSLQPPSVVNNDIFICKLNPLGEIDWVKNIGSVTNEGEVNGNITTDNQCNFYATGWFSDRSMLGKFNGNGDLIWQKQFGQNNRVFGQDVKVDDGGNVYFMAIYYDNVTIDTYTLSGSSQGNTLICKMNPAGVIEWIVSNQPGVNTSFYSLTKGPDHDLYFVGAAGGNFRIGNISLNLDAGDPVILKLKVPVTTSLPSPQTPTLNLGGDVLLCKGESIKLGMPGFAKYLWNDGVTDSIRFVSTEGQYSLTTYDACGKIQQDTVLVTLCYVPPVLDLGPDRILCPNQNLNITLEAFATYLWQDGTTAATYLFTQPGTYYVRVTDLVGGIQSDTLTLLPCPPPPVLDLGDDDQLCDGQTITLSLSGFADYLWQDDSTQPTLTITRPGKYYVTVTDLYGEIQKDTIVFVRCPHPELELGDDLILCNNETIMLELENFIDFVWQDGSTSSSFLIAKPGVYYVTTTDQFGLKKSDTLRVTECFFIPNVITPNHDNHNDFFVVQGVDENYAHPLRIYNRWGQEVFYASNYQNDWGAVGLASGEYFYHFTDEKTKEKYTGWVQVIK